MLIYANKPIQITKLTIKETIDNNGIGMKNTAGGTLKSHFKKEQILFNLYPFPFL